ncbi:hypothetical protein PHAVU_009G173700 [Phaseolus vulgaris]|uniref:Uncharacterized protein n=1 Tax=Phaseolus vulgaris TaxID=3885 RepID=V7B0K9_PHAVU|nr:hypothetical protein PHAVU_009G173700g [Phaseolus vulgaris]ESW10006.1 hypothetical protein PHAVU_009G173700g [Phaseolus vulgaris]
MSLYSICFYHMPLSLVLFLLLLFHNHFVWLKFNNVFYILSQHLHLHLCDDSYISLMPDIKWHCMRLIMGRVYSRGFLNLGRVYSRGFLNLGLY